MLTEQRKQQLDGIVGQMSSQKETDATIQFVVDDFKAKYEDEITLPEQPQGVPSVGGFLTGAVKRGAETLQNIGQGVLASPALIPGGQTFGERRQEIQETTGFRPETLERRGTAEKIGAFAEGIAEFAVPITKVSTVTKGLNFFARLASRAFTSAGVATAQSGKVGQETAIAGAIELAIPAGSVVLKPIVNIIRRLVKGLGSGLSGVSTDAINTIIQNPRKAQQVVRELEKSGNFSVLEKNAKVIIDGVSKIRQDARRIYGEGVQTLKSIDINTTTFRTSIQGFLDDVGSVVKGKFRTLKNVEFEKPALINKASGLIDDLSRVELNGFSLRKLLNKIGNSRFKTTGGDAERLSFNAFITDMEKATKDAIGKSTNKLDEINKAFSLDMQLVEGIERIFGKVKFKSLAEIDRITQQLETLFSKKGFSPKIIDDFLIKLGIKPSEFKVTEAIRQISGKTLGANRVGLTFAELTQELTSAIVTPETVRNLSIATGLAEPIIRKLMEVVAPTLRATLIKLVIDSQQ